MTARFSASPAAMRRRHRVGRPCRSLFAALLATATLPSLVGATIEGSPKYFPASYGPGDTVAVIVPIAPGPGEIFGELSLAPGSGLPPDDGRSDPQLLGVEIAKIEGRWSMTARFVAWSPVEGSIEAFQAGGIEFPSIPYRAGARLKAEDIDPTPPHGQRLPPRAALVLYGLVGALAAGGLAVFGFLAYLIPAARGLVSRWREAQAFRRLSTTLDYLAARASSSDPAAYSAALGRALRTYLAARFLPQALVLTPGELSDLPETAFPAPSTRDRAAALLSWTDGLRFGGLPARVAELEGAVAEARRLASENEEAIRARP